MQLANKIQHFLKNLLDLDLSLPFCPEPKYLGVTLVGSLTCRRHLNLLLKKLSSWSRFYDTCRTQSEVQVVKHYAQQPRRWSIPLQSTAHLSGVVVLIPAKSTLSLAVPCVL